MGTDRKGPLAAFVVIAIVAAILLVTSVRSQAEPPWVDHDQLPATVVAAPPIDDPLRWAPVVTVGQVVEDGVVLAPKATPAPTAVPASAVLVPAAATSYDGSVPATTWGNPTTHTVTVTHHHAAQHAGHHARHHTRHHTRHTRHHSATASTTTQVDQLAVSSPTAQQGSPTRPSHGSAVPAAHGHGRHLGWRHRS